MKKTLVIIALMVGLLSSAQNKKIIFGFDKIPQGLLVNPGSETTYKYHIGVPMLSGVSVDMNMSGITLADVFRDNKQGALVLGETNDGESIFNANLKAAIKKLGDNDYVYSNSQIDVLNAGYKISSKDYLSGGFYVETDIFATLPKDLAILATEGNSGSIGKTFDLSKASVQAETLGVLHLGISRRLNSRLTAGARLKLYSGSASFVSKNSGKFSTVLGTDSKYIHTFDNFDVALNTSGVYDKNDKVDLTAKKVFGGSFFKGNFGVGVDLGFTFHMNEQHEFTGSLLDFGTVSYSKDLWNRKAKGSYTFKGVEYKYDGGTSNYWKDLEEDFDKNIEHSDNTSESFKVTRPLKANLMYAYSWGRSLNRTNCHDNTFKDFFDNTVGGHVFAVSQPTGINLAYTAFYQRKLSKHLNLKATYTVDDFSYANIGLGMSLNIWKLNIYGAYGNVFGITDVAKTHVSSGQIGVNFIMN